MNDNPRDAQADELLIVESLRLLDQDAAAVDSSAIATAVEFAGDVFERGEVGAARTIVRPTLQIVRSDQGASRMLAGNRTVVTLTGCLLAVVIWLAAWSTSDRDQLAFGAVLDRTLDADMLQLRVTRDGKSADVWIREATDIRWQESPTRYQIASGSKLWRIDENDNVAVLDESPWASIAGEVDVWSLLGVGDSVGLREAKPVGRQMHEGRLCDVFKFDTKHDEQTYEVRAFSDRMTHRLLTLAAWKQGRVRQDAPVAELRLIARNKPIDAAQFQVPPTLTADGRIGKLEDSQGIVTLRSALAERWTPVAREMLLRTGDWLRTDIRGANAARVDLSSSFQVTAGPGSQLQFVNPNEIRLRGGDVQIKGVKGGKSGFTLKTRDGKTLQIPARGNVIVRMTADGSLVKLKKKPMWLEGFDGSSAQESLGSLIAKVDGRDVKLSVSEHHADVMIRDQIARTTITQAFHNHTNVRTEGVFHFPLPQDASISGFAMWIGDELIEADVVEKQRAREIYETILRENRDPALLEWTGGNIFKARVFPIEANSDKRIRIQYTHVLPMRNQQYRYSYALRSELLRKNPVRELSVSVTVNSAQPIFDVKCPTHDADINHAARTASVKFDAQEYTPERDFEVVVQVGERPAKPAAGSSDTSSLVVIPHRRGDDGYFLLQFAPPGTNGAWTRELIPDGKPLEVLLVCDTSASMDSANRTAQLNFVSALLASLGPKDRFNVAVCDVDCHWLFQKPTAVADDARKQATDWLADRVSLGWTDLDRTFASIAKRIRKSSHVIYVGDGIVSAGDADPAAFASRVTKLYRDKTGATFHAVSVGSSFESTVLQSIAGIGSGSVRNINGERTPQAVAVELLGEIAQPSLRDLEINFKGVRVAAVYPKRLPNLAAGTQQIVIGRYLPGDKQVGQVIITGKRGDESEHFAAMFKLPSGVDRRTGLQARPNIDAPAIDATGLETRPTGNSFIPRLWARAHLNNLLAQGSGGVIKDQVIALSEEFHIITPFTSLLVLESDADRARFKVKRRYQMRDGERYFAEGRDNATFDLLQEQMRQAGAWRVGLRQQVLNELASLGRDPAAFREVARQLSRFEWFAEMRDFGLSDSRDVSSYFLSLGEGRTTSENRFDSWGLEGSVSLEKSLMEFGQRVRFDSESTHTDLAPSAGANRVRMFRGEQVEWFDEPPLDSYRYTGGTELSEVRSWDVAAFAPYGESKGQFLRRASLDLVGLPDIGRLTTLGPMHSPSDATLVWNPTPRAARSTQWVNAYFQSLARPQIVVPRQPKSRWQPDMLALSKRLLVDDELAKLKGGFEVHRRVESIKPRWQRTTDITEHTVLFSPRAWVSRRRSKAADTITHFCDGKQRGVYSHAFELGRVRASLPSDLRPIPLGVDGFTQQPLHEAYPDRIVLAMNDEAGILDVFLIIEDAPHRRYVVTIDEARNVVLRERAYAFGKLLQTSSRRDFVQVAGRWWPQTIEVSDEQGRVTSRTKLTYKTFDADGFAKRLAAETSDHDAVRFLKSPAPQLADAEDAVADGTANFEHRFLLLLRAFTQQNWDDALTQLAALEAIAGDSGHRGLQWIRPFVLQAAGRNEDSRQALLALIPTVLARQSEELFLAEHLYAQAERVGSPRETMAVLDVLQPLIDRQLEYTHAKLTWTDHRITLLRRMLPGTAIGQSTAPTEELRLREQQARVAPWNSAYHVNFTNALIKRGERAAAYAWLRKQIESDSPWQTYERERLRDAYADMLRSDARVDELIAFYADWMKKLPTSDSGYQRYLSAFTFANRTHEADKLAREWLSEARVANKLSDPARSKLRAAINWAIGSRHGLSTKYRLPGFDEALIATGLHFMQHSHHADVTRRIMDEYRIRDSQILDRLHAEIASVLKGDVNKLKIDLFADFVARARRHRLLKGDEWERVANTLRSRHDATKLRSERRKLGGALSAVYIREFKDQLLPFRRHQIELARKEGDGLRVVELTQTLFNELLQNWSVKNETEAFGLITKLTTSDSPAAQLASQIDALGRLVDEAIAAEIREATQKLQVEGHPEKMTRTDLAKLRSSFRESARRRMVTRLGEELGKHDGQFADWIRLELAYFAVRLGETSATPKGLNNKAQGRAVHPGKPEPNKNPNPEGFPQAVTPWASCWKIIGDVPPHIDPQTEPQNAADIEAIKMASIDAKRLQRAIAVLMHLAAQPAAKKSAGERLLKYIDLAIKNNSEHAAAWKGLKFKLLIALDRGDELEADLRTWIKVAARKRGESPQTWRTHLARLLAERGKLNGAIELFETVERESQLSFADYKLLAAWYAAKGNKPDHKRSRLAAFNTMSARNIKRWLDREYSRWSNPRSATILDEQILVAFEVMLTKAADPEDTIRTLQKYYRATRDFRLLKMVPETVIGRSPHHAYVALGHARDRLLREIRVESTADELLAHLKQLHASSKSPLDRRTLDLMECMVARQASRVLNQPGAHLAAAIAALTRAFAHEWTDGELPLMARLLDNMGSIERPALAELRLKQARQLHAMTKPGTDENLAVAWHLAHVLTYRENNRQAGIDVMEAAVRSFEQSHPDGWPYGANDRLNSYVRLLTGAGHYAAAESTYRRQIVNPANAGQKQEFQHRLDRLYVDALRNGGRVSLGEGRTLFDNLIPYLVNRITTTMDGEREGVYLDLTNAFTYASEQKLSVSEELRKFAFEQFPKLIAEQLNDYDDIVQDVADAVKLLLGDAAGASFLVERLEHYPQRFDDTYYDGWRQFAYRLGKWFAEARATASQPTSNAAARAEIEELAPRVLKLTLAALRRDLTTRQTANRHIYSDTRYFWGEKRADFVRVAEEVLAKHRDSRRHVLHIAKYIEDSLGSQIRAVEILLIARKAGVLRPSDDGNIADHLIRLNRFGEAISLLEGLVDRNPDSMNCRVRLINAYHQAERLIQSDGLLATTDKHFRSASRWTESHIAQLARVCTGVEKHEEAISYYAELIPLHERSHGTRDNKTLSTYYGELADLHATLGQTKEAIDAASAAIVARGQSHKYRKQAIDRLRSILQSADDLDDYIKHLDKQSAEQNQDSPLIRRLAGEAYARLEDHEQAVKQLRKAVELQPTDIATHDALIKSLDALDRIDEATTQLLALIDIDRHNLSRFEQLVKRFANNELAAERAATSIVESAPSEAENHTALAELRESQARLPEAIEHWKRVAELRALEPTGLQRLAAAQVKAGQLDAARSTLKKLTSREWPTRFEDLNDQIEALRMRLEKR